MKVIKLHIKAMLVMLIIGTLTMMITSLPWWSFTIPIVITGVIISGKQWRISFFWMGFISGFILWSGANLYFDLLYPGDVLTNVGRLLFIPKIIVFIISGLIGGLLTGLSFYTGKIIFSPNKTKSIEDNLV